MQRGWRKQTHTAVIQFIYFRRGTVCQFLFISIFFIQFNRFTSKIKIDDQGPSTRTSEKLYALLQEKLTGWTVTMSEKCEIAVASVQIVVESDPKGAQKNILLSWNNQDEELGSYVLGLLQNMG